MMRLLAVALLTMGTIAGAQGAPAGLGETPDPATATFPVNYTGNDLPLVIRRFEAWRQQLSSTRKGEFETSAEFEVRSRAAQSRDLDYGVPMSTRFAFVFPIQLRYDADRQAFSGGSLGEAMDSLRRLSPEPDPIGGREGYSFIMGPTVGPIRSVVPYDGRRGTTIMVQQSDTLNDGISFCWRRRADSFGPWSPSTPCRLTAETISFAMPRDRAREVSPRLRIAVFGTIDRDKQIVTGWSGGRTPEPDYPYNSTWRATFLPIAPTAAVVFDQQTGEVVHRLNLAPPAPARNARPARRQ